MISVAEKDFKCNNCGESLPTDRGYAQCSADINCKNHFKCAKIKESTWIQQGSTRRSKWICINHRNPSRSGSNSSSDSLSQEVLPPKTSQAKPVGTTRSIAGPSKSQPSKSTQINTAKSCAAEAEKLESDQTQMEELKKFIDERIKQVENKIDQLNEKIEKQNIEIETIKLENSELKEENLLLRKEIDNLSLQTNNFEAYTRRKNLVIRGIKETKEELVPSIVIKLGDTLGVPIRQEDIESSFRIQTRKPSQARPILVKLRSHTLKEKIISEARKKKPTEGDIVHGGNLQLRVFCEEHLAPNTRKILNNCLEAKRGGQIFQVWTSAGRICVRLRSGGAAQKVDSVDHLDQLLRERPEAKE
uniref:Uncharacterized protein n=1 Tax=Lygus hesperus TaxID=30085 RepID=A0A0A9X1G8_LYGHE